MTDKENLALLERALELARDAREISQAEMLALLDWIEVLIDAAGSDDGMEEELDGDPDG